MQIPDPLERLIDGFMRFPGIGFKTAQRLAFCVTSMDEDDVIDFSKSLISVRRDLSSCSTCGSLTTSDTCDICKNPNRDQTLICVVQEFKDVLAMERIQEYRGLYHVLQGCISPLNGIGPDDLNLETLLERLSGGQVEELILASNPNLEGEATAMYIARLVKPLNVKVTRIAHGLPVGGDLEYADEITLIKALEGRREL